ncbi:uncharacterized protein LOC143253121 isoform X1 [Tachypleus tridentatus]|uniref:uncharacterized protein LOC143253121 isoform X1 n=1 Tax=Tachypleus tridentatus TaxID=6853 RepID=UPI003FCF7264
MAEPRRIAFETVGTLAKDNKPKELFPTYRFSLTLEESNDKTCPEFSYSDLVKSTRGDQDIKKKTTDDDPFDDDDEDKLRKIAKKFEEKYGPRTIRNKKIDQWEDYIDRGMGYDETDPFIDNEEAYDELVPSTLTTQYGGFYINSGGLEFRTVSDTEEIPEGHKPKRRKHKYKELLEREGKRRRRIKDGDHVPKKRGRKPLDKSLSALGRPKKKTQPTVATLLQQHKAQLQQQQELIVREHGTSLSYSPSSVDNVEGGVPKDNAKIKDAIESVIKAAGEEIISNGNIGLTTASSDSEDVRQAVDSMGAPKLPENLPAELDDLLTKIKQAAYTSEEGKCKFFSNDVNTMLLKIELKSRELSCSQRSMIYTHLAFHLPCTKETILKRAKKLRLDQEDEKLREPLQCLKDAISEVIPLMEQKYAEACQKASLEVSKGNDKDLTDLQATGSEEDSDEGEYTQISNLPRRKFEWNNHLRKLLCEVVTIKLKCYEVKKTRTQSAEEYLMDFLSSEVKALWPDGWIQTRVLLRESRDAHHHLINRPRKSAANCRKVGVLSSTSVSPSSVGKQTGVTSLGPSSSSPQDGHEQNVNTTRLDLSEQTISNSVESGTESEIVSAIRNTVPEVKIKLLDFSELPYPVQHELKATATSKDIIPTCATTSETAEEVEVGCSRSISAKSSELSSIKHVTEGEPVSLSVNKKELQKIIPDALLTSPLSDKSISNAFTAKPHPCNIESEVTEKSKTQTVINESSLMKSESVDLKPLNDSLLNSVNIVVEKLQDQVLSASEKCKASFSTSSVSGKTLSQVSLPSKNILSLVTSENTAKPVSHGSLASDMLDRIICASLGNFPNCGSSVLETSGLVQPIKSEPFSPGKVINTSVIQNQGKNIIARPLSQPTEVHQCASSSQMSVLGSTNISILKSSVKAALHRREPSQETKLISIGPEQQKVATSVSILCNSNIQQNASSVPSSTGVNVAASSEFSTVPPMMPYHPYGFLEAFKKSLEGRNVRQDNNISLSSSKSPESVKKETTPRTSRLSNSGVRNKSTHCFNSTQGASQALQQPSLTQFTSQDLMYQLIDSAIQESSLNDKKPNRTSTGLLESQVQQQPSSPEQPLSTGLNLEGMKGFPIPKQHPSSGQSQILSKPLPCSYSLHPTALAQSRDPSFISPAPSKSPSPQRVKPVHSPSPKTTMPLPTMNNPFPPKVSHFTQAEPPAPWNTQRQNHWRGTPSPTSGYSTQQQYQNLPASPVSSPSMVYSGVTSPIGHQQHSFSPPVNIPPPAHRYSPSPKQVIAHHTSSQPLKPVGSPSAFPPNQSSSPSPAHQIVNVQQHYHTPRSPISYNQDYASGAIVGQQISGIHMRQEATWIMCSHF